mmetsp:Transcript_35657/g.42968  ORF Transcript_35657/g.42968 Transcript_35657/m.42968 type:complete len:169 (+) Transcript_35657:72-578(+)
MQALSAKTALAGTRITCPSAANSSTARTPVDVVAKEMTRKERVKRRHQRLRQKISGTAERPRLSVFRSNLHTYAQFIDDTANEGLGYTMAHWSTCHKETRAKLAENSEEDGGPLKTRSIKAAHEVGLTVGTLAKERGINTCVFDRGGNLYAGRVKALAEGARESGLIF